MEMLNGRTRIVFNKFYYLLLLYTVAILSTGEYLYVLFVLKKDKIIFVYNRNACAIIISKCVTICTYVYIEISTHIIMIDLVVILKINYT